MTFQLDALLSEYDKVLTQLEQSDSLLPEDVWAVLVHRDRIQQALQAHIAACDPANVDLGRLMLLLAPYDQRLRTWGTEAANAFEFADWRSLIIPNSQAWWWFLDATNQPQPSDNLNTYEQCLTHLAKQFRELQVLGEEGGSQSLNAPGMAEDPTSLPADTKLSGVNSQPATRQILAICLVRDALQRNIENEQLNADELAQLSHLDGQFQQQLAQLSENADRRYLGTILEALDKVRSTVAPSPEAWWWFVKVNVHWWDHLDWVWNTLTVVWLTASFSLLTDTATRFLAGGPGLLGGFAVIGQAFLALAGGGSFTQTGQRKVEGTLEQLNLPKHYWQEARFIGATALLLAFIGMRSSLPTIARAYNNIGLNLHYRNGDFSSAEANYQRALALDPDLAPAHYNLGLLYEDLQNYEAAHAEYAFAVQAGLIPAYNNLARIEILEGRYREALSLLQDPRVQTYVQSLEADPGVEYSLLKNRAWALQGLGFHQDAIDELNQAIELNQENGTAYCLLARSLEELEQAKSAFNAWEKCIEYEDTLRNPEEYEWLYLARERLHDDGTPAK